MTLLADLEEFVAAHRLHGPLTGDATEPAWNGHRLTVTCPCGVVFERWVTPQDAEHDLKPWLTEQGAAGLSGQEPSRPSTGSIAGSLRAVMEQ